MLFSKDFAIGYRSIRKTERLIDQVQALVAEKFADLVIDPTDKKGRFHEYGLYTKTRNGQDLLWVGVWPDFSDQHPYPISVGVEHASDKDEKLRKAFRAAWPAKTVEFGGYTVGWFAREIIESDDPGKRMFEQLVPVMNKLVEAAALRKGATRPTDIRF